MKYAKLFAVGFIVVFLAGCGLPVDVPNAYVAKKKTPQGLQDGVIYPSSFRLDACFREPCDRIILLENPDYQFEESLDFVVPADKLKLSVDIRGRLRLRTGSEDAINLVFSRVPGTSVEGSSRISQIHFQQVYLRYARDIIRTVVRAELSENSIATNISNREILGVSLGQAVEKALEQTPVELTYLGIAKMDPPEVILAAEIKAKEREIAIKEANAQKQIDLAKAEAREEVARKNQAADLIEAETQVLVNTKMAEGVSEAWALQRGLKILEQIAASDNKVILLPTEALTNPAVMIGVNNQALKQD